MQRIACQHQTSARRERQDVRAHRLEFLVRRPRRVACRVRAATRETAPAEAANRRPRGRASTGLMSDIRCITSLRSAPVRQRHLDHADRVTHERTKLPDAVGVRAISAAYGDRPLVEPDQVAALELSRRCDAAGDRHAELERLLLRGRFCRAGGLAHRAEDQSRWRDDRRIAHVNRIERRSWIVGAASAPSRRSSAGGR